MTKPSLAIALAAVFIILAPKITRSQTPPPFPLEQPRPETLLSKIVVFITVKLKPSNQAGAGANADKPQVVSGTGFLVGVPGSHGGFFTYLVTNRHVAEAIEQDKQGNCVPHPIKQTYVTMNLKQSTDGSQSDRQPLFMSQQVHWYFPKDDAVDLAVIPFAPAPKYDYLVLPTTDFLQPEIIANQRVVPGDRILTAGLFFAYSGLHQMQPILREGVLAMLPDGPMITTTCKSGSIYLADIHITPGNSGSPVFVIPELGLGVPCMISGVTCHFGLLGVVSGYMRETEDLTLQAVTTWQGSVQANSGVSVVVPVQQLRDLLNSPEIQHLQDPTPGQLPTR